jgi:hypothetical protein
VRVQDQALGGHNMAQDNLKYAPTVNNFTTTLNGAISASATTLNLNSVTGLQNKAGILVVDRVDNLGSLTATKQEWIYFTGVSGSAVTLPSAVDGRGVGGSTAQSHADGAIVEAVFDVSIWGGFVTSYIAQHNDAGYHLGITAQTLGLSSNASISGNVFSNTLNTASTASISGTLNVKNVIATNLSILSCSSIADNTITANSLATGAITLGYAQVTSDQGTITTVADLTNLAVTVTVPTGGRRVEITGHCLTQNTNATVQDIIAIQEGATVLDLAQVVTGAANAAESQTAHAIVTPAAGSHTYKLTGQATAGTMTLKAPATSPAFILVNLI